MIIQHVSSSSDNGDKCKPVQPMNSTKAIYQIQLLHLRVCDSDLDLLLEVKN